MDLNAWKILLEGCTADGTVCTTAGVPFGGGNAVECETGIFLYALMRRFQPQTVFESGSHWGFSSACMALGLKDNVKLYPRKSCGKLYTMDMNEYEGKPEALWKRIGVDNVIHLICSSEEAESYKQIDPNMKFEWVWADADHDGPAIMREFDNYLPFLSRKRCIIGFHDTSLDDRMHAGIMSILEKLTAMKEAKTGWEFISHWPMRNMRGMDLIMLNNAPFRNPSGWSA